MASKNPYVGVDNFTKELDNSRSRFTCVEDFTRSDTAEERTEKIIKLMEADTTGFASILDKTDGCVRNDIKNLIIYQERILDELYNRERTAKLRKLNQPFSTIELMSIQIARQILNSRQVYND